MSPCSSVVVEVPKLGFEVGGLIVVLTVVGVAVVGLVVLVSSF